MKSRLQSLEISNLESKEVLVNYFLWILPSQINLKIIQHDNSVLRIHFDADPDPEFGSIRRKWIRIQIINIYLRFTDFSSFFAYFYAKI